MLTLHTNAMYDYKNNDKSVENAEQAVMEDISSLL